jgi:hypothetical protein
VQLVGSEANGGKTTEQELDAALDSPEATVLTVSGLDQKGLEHLARRFGKQLIAVHFWKCPRIEDLSPLEDMRELTHAAFYWNQRARCLWDLSKTPKLRGLQFDDFTRLPGLLDLERGRTLTELAFGNRVWTRFVVPTLEPLAALSKLKSLRFNLRRVDDRRIEPLAGLKQLTDLEFSSGLFTTGQLAWLRARLPDCQDSSVLQPFRVLAHPLTVGAKHLDVIVMGKGKPFLSTRDDAARLQRYVAAFDELVARYAANPDTAPQ